MRYGARQVTSLWGIALGLVIVGAMSGCGSGSSSASPSTPGRCAADSDCPDDQQCRRGYCTVRQRAEQQVGVRFLPPNSSPFPAQKIQNVSVASGESLDFALDPSVRVDGAIVPQGSSRLGPSGTLVFRQPDAAGTRLDHRTPVSNGNFQGYVRPGRYHLAFVPSDPKEFPSRVWRNRVFTRQTQLELAVPRLIEVEGNLLFRPSLAAEGESRGVARARVFAVSSDGNYTSTVDTTGGQGYYRLKLVPGTGTYDLYVRPASEEAVVPRVVFEGAISSDQGETGEQASRLLGTYPDPNELVSVTLQLEAPDRLGGETDGAGTEVRLEASVGKGRIDERAIADEEGRVAFDLLPVRYEVHVQPPTGSPLAATSFCLDLTGTPREDCRSLPPEPIELSTKRRVTGRLLDAAGEPVGGGTVAFEAVEPRTDVQAPPGRISATTDDDGTFALWLADHDYLVHLQPSAASGRPRTVRFLESTRVTDDEGLELRLAAPSLLSGTVLGRGSDKLIPLAETTLEFFVRRRDRLVTIGTARTGGEGRFDVVLPARERDASP
jgi:hypothetical protein